MGPRPGVPFLGIELLGLAWWKLVATLFLCRCTDMIESIEVIDMIREATAMKVRQNLGELLNEVQYRKGRIVITKAGKPVAAIVDIDLFERIRRLDDEFETVTREIVEAFADVKPEKGMGLVDEAVTAARRKTPKR